jgi:hypothetical protein
MIIHIAPRRAGKTTRLLQELELAKSQGKTCIVVSKPPKSKKELPTYVSAEYLLECLLKNKDLDWFTDPQSYEALFFEEPSLYWTEFLAITNILPKSKLAYASYTPVTKEQSELTEFNMSKVTSVWRTELVWPTP